MKLSIIIVNYKVPKHLLLCLKSLEVSLQNIDSEVIVVDNNSQDDSESFIKKHYPTLKWIQNTENVGFSKANNIGVSEAKGEFITLLNPDTFVNETVFEELLNFASTKEKLGIVGVRMIDGNGNFHPESKRNIPNPYNSFLKLFLFRKKDNPYYAIHIDEKTVAEVEILSGAFMFMKKNLYQELKGLDEQYFMYGEDIDISYLALQKGFQNYYFGISTIIHYKGESTQFNQIFLKRFFGAMKIYIHKYHSQTLLKKYFLLLGIDFKYFWNIFMFTFLKKPIKSKAQNPKILIFEKNATEIISRLDKKEENIAIQLKNQDFYIQ